MREAVSAAAAATTHQAAGVAIEDEGVVQVGRDGRVERRDRVVPRRQGQPVLPRRVAVRQPRRRRADGRNVVGRRRRHRDRRQRRAQLGVERAAGNLQQAARARAMCARLRARYGWTYPLSRITAFVGNQ